MIRKKFSTYNDGVLLVYKEKRQTTNFNAVKNTRTIDDLEFVVKLDYEEKSKRDTDLDFAEAQGRTLTLKVKTRLYHLDKTLMVVIGNIMYSIINLDEDRANGEMYFYLEEVRELA